MGNAKGYNKEIFIGLVGAIGTNMDEVSSDLIEILNNEVNYEVQSFKLSSFIREDLEFKEEKKLEEEKKKNSIFVEGVDKFMSASQQTTN